MTLTSISFYIFLPICILIYFLIPSRIRYIWLLLCSYFFYSTLDGAFVTLLIISTAATWISGNAISAVKRENVRRLILAAGIILNVSILIVYKYENFFLA